MSVHSRAIVRAAKLGKTLQGPEGDLRILGDLDLEVLPGDAVSIRGMSGSGKSTLLGLLAGLDQATEGEVYLFEQPLTPLDETPGPRCAPARSASFSSPSTSWAE